MASPAPEAAARPSSAGSTARRYSRGDMGTSVSGPKRVRTRYRTLAPRHRRSGGASGYRRACAASTRAKTPGPNTRPEASTVRRRSRAAGQRTAHCTAGSTSQAR
uniref:Uncharacterized protein n=2 Tax=Human herpesvirus 2 TaxID=10310 RepID=A0A481THT9_HHV2|nr:hypothetical protein [Human alphaherpesvirus 2]QBH83923.1 hypothetical protein [Human alphaherpesvirus 2]